MHLTDGSEITAISMQSHARKPRQKLGCVLHLGASCTRVNTVNPNALETAGNSNLKISFDDLVEETDQVLCIKSRF